jgi:hypothetical protein
VIAPAHEDQDLRDSSARALQEARDPSRLGPPAILGTRRTERPRCATAPPQCRTIDRVSAPV